MNAKRNDEHTYAEYRAAMKNGERALRLYREGQWFWRSKCPPGSPHQSQGTYRKPKPQQVSS